MERYEPTVEDGVLFLVSGEDRVEIGRVDDVVDAIGGETYTIEYDEKQRMQPWLETDEGALDIEVRDAVTSMAHTEELVSDLRGYDMDTDRYGLPTRTVEFANSLVDILEQQGAEE